MNEETIIFTYMSFCATGIMLGIIFSLLYLGTRIK